MSVLNEQLIRQDQRTTRKVYAVVPPKAEHSLTDFGKTLIPVIAALGNWGDEHEERLREVILRRLGTSGELGE